MSHDSKYKLCTISKTLNMTKQLIRSTIHSLSILYVMIHLKTSSPLNVSCYDSFDNPGPGPLNFD